MDASYFPGRLQELREQSGLTQLQLADKAGMTREGIAQLETGRRSPAWESVVALCQALGVKCDAFLQAPAERPARLGRPPKAKALDAAPALKRPRGRPKKAK